MGPSGGPVRKRKLIAEINMVPFIDIVLVLLIIFMIVSPFIAQSQINVNLPKASAASSGGDESPLRIQITRNGNFYVDNKRIRRKWLAEKIRKEVTSGRNTVLIEADRDVSFKNVVVALDAAQKTKAGKVGVAVMTIDRSRSTDKEKKK